MTAIAQRPHRSRAHLYALALGLLLLLAIVLSVTLDGHKPAPRLEGRGVTPAQMSH